MVIDQGNTALPQIPAGLTILKTAVGINNTMNVSKVNLVSASTFLSLMVSRWTSSEQAPFPSTERLYRTTITAVLILSTTRDVKRTAAVNALTTGTALVGMIHWTKMMNKHQFSQHDPASQVATEKSKEIDISFQWHSYGIWTFIFEENISFVSESSNTFRIHNMYFDKQPRNVSIQLRCPLTATNLETDQSLQLLRLQTAKKFLVLIYTSLERGTVSCLSISKRSKTFSLPS